MPTKAIILTRAAAALRRLVCRFSERRPAPASASDARQAGLQKYYWIDEDEEVYVVVPVSTEPEPSSRHSGGCCGDTEL